MAEDDDWPEDMPPVEDSLGLNGSKVSDEVSKKIAEEALGADTNGAEDVSGRKTMTLYIDGENHVFVNTKGCSRCGSDADGVLYRDSWDRRGVTGGAYMLCQDCKEEVMPKHEKEGFEWNEF